MSVVNDVWERAVHQYGNERGLSHTPAQLAHLNYLDWIIGRVDEDFLEYGPKVARWFLAAAHLNHRQRQEGQKPDRLSLGDPLPDEAPWTDAEVKRFAAHYFPVREHNGQNVA